MNTEKREKRLACKKQKVKKWKRFERGYSPTASRDEKPNWEIDYFLLGEKKDYEKKSTKVFRASFFFGFWYFDLQQIN